MDFRNEYKNVIAGISPDEAAAERIRKGVAEKLAAETPKRTPFPVKRTAAIGGSLAACLVVGVTAVMLSGGFGGGSFTDKFCFDTPANENMAGGSAPRAPFNGAEDGGMNCDTAPEANVSDINGGVPAGGETSDSTPNSVAYPDSYIKNDNGGDRSNALAPPTAVAESPEGSNEDFRPESNGMGETARITLTENGFTLEYGGGLTAYEERNGFADNADDLLSAESGDFIEAVLPNGRKMLLRLSGNEAALYDEEYTLLGYFVGVE